MPSEPHEPSPKPLRGLDPSKLLGVLDSVRETKPHVPGWEVIGIAGRGGFGIVWRARRESDGVIAAIKIAPASDPDTLERIEEEAGALRSLDHPNIVSLMDSGPLDDTEGGFFLAMEFIEGGRLSHEIPAEGLPPDRAYTLFHQIAAAVDHAHEAGILHRDLKPANILLDAGGRARVADFGLALPVHRRVHQLSLTRAGLIAGTAEYLPPEAYRQDYRPSPAADIFALGIILHEMLTGTPPRGAWPPVSSKRRVDVRVDLLIRRALEPDPACRWSSVREMVAALDSILTSSPRHAGTPLITLPVRIGDCLWSLMGFWMLLASTSSLMHLRKSRLTLPFDLIAGHEDRVGGFQALFVLLLAAIPLGAWQLLRLRRFRSVPLREALPSPWGLRLGHGRAAATLVGTWQFFALLVPALHMISIFLDSSLVWLHSGDPPWMLGLTVTRWSNNTPVSPWTMGNFGEGFWLWESLGPPAHPLAKRLDRIGFIPFFVPAIMVAGAAILAASIAVTLLTSIRAWWHRDHRSRAAVLALVTVASVTALAKSSAREVHKANDGRRAGFHNAFENGRMTDHISQLADFLIGKRPLQDLIGFKDDWLEFYGETVDYRDHGRIPRDQIPRLLEAGRMPAERRVVEVTDRTVSWNRENGGFLFVSRAVETFNGLGSSADCGAVDLTLELSGVVEITGHTAILKESLQRSPMYVAEDRVADASEATAWVRALHEALAMAPHDTPASKQALAPLFHPVSRGLAQEPLLGWIREMPEPDGELMRLLDVGLSPLPDRDLVIEGSFPGGRTRIAIPIAGSPLTPGRSLRADLIHESGAWRCVRLAY